MVTGGWFEPDDEHSQKPNYITTIRPKLRMAMKNISIMTFWPQFWRVTWVSECEWLNSIPLWFCRFQSFKEQGQAHGKPCSQEHIQTEVEGSNQHYKIAIQVQCKGLLPWQSRINNNHHIYYSYFIYSFIGWCNYNNRYNLPVYMQEPFDKCENLKSM